MGGAPLLHGSGLTAGLHDPGLVLFDGGGQGGQGTGLTLDGHGLLLPAGAEGARSLVVLLQLLVAPGGLGLLVTDGTECLGRLLLGCLGGIDLEPA